MFIFHKDFYKIFNIYLKHFKTGNILHLLRIANSHASVPTFSIILEILIYALFNKLVMLLQM